MKKYKAKIDLTEKSYILIFYHGDPKFHKGP